jgi:FMN phosphatase YigB (HAD superfamily)
MILNQRPDCTLKDVFEAVYFPSLGLNETDVRSASDQFYDDIYPSLKKYTRQKPEAIRFVQKAFERNYQVAIATNPIFPYKAIAQRLSWAGLSPEIYPYALVPSYETFHFAKPNPAYLAEILARLGWPNGPVVMVGDDRQHDIHTANSLGIASYWISEAHDPPPGDSLSPAAEGDLSNLQEWLNTIPKDALLPEFNGPPALLAILRSTPAALSYLCSELLSSGWTERPQPDEWSMTEILCHLRDVEIEVNIPRLNQVLENSNPFLPGMDTDPWADERQYITQDGGLALQQFTASRIRTINILAYLSPEDWVSPARHAIFGPTNLTELAGFIAEHDRLHVRQVYEVIHNS